MVANKEYTVTVKYQETVAAILPEQELRRRPLSNLDLLLPPIDFGVFFCYQKPAAGEVRNDHRCTTFVALVSSLKAALAQVLATYYPLAGTVDVNSAGEPELLCSNRGVDFIEAYADVELRELKLHKPDESVENKLMPKKKKGVLCVQATKLKCGGMVLSCTFDHRIVDAYSANMFLVAWSEVAAGKPLSRVPSFHSSLLSPRHPLQYANPSYDALYAPFSSFITPSTTNCHGRNHVSGGIFVNRLYYMTAEDVHRLQSSTNNGRTKVEAFIAYLWRVIAKASAPKDGACRMGIVVDGRARLDGSAMRDYFGNVLSVPYGTLEPGELARMGLDEVAEVVHECLQMATNGEHFRGLVDLIEAWRPEPKGIRINRDEVGMGASCVVSSGRSFPVGQVEFGWGKAVVGSYCFPWEGSANYVMPMPSTKGNGDWVVYAHVAAWVAKALETERPQLFCLMEPEYYLFD